MNIFLRELKANLKSLIIWAVIALLFVVMGMGKFSAYYENPEMLAILDSVPPALLNAFGMNAFNLTTVTGFYGVMFTFFGVLVAIAGAMWGSDIISKEERDKTLEFSFTLPVKRSTMITAKSLAVLVNSIALILVLYLSMIFSVQQYTPTAEFYEFLNISIFALLIIELIFLTIGILLGCALKQHKQSGSLAVSIMLGTYFISVIAGFYPDWKFLKYLSPFMYFDPAVMFRESSLDVTYVLLSAGIIVVSLVGAYFTYSRRDLYI